MTTNLTPDEQELREFIERSLTDVHGDAHRFETRAVARGRTLRLRRRIGAGLAGAAVVATVAALVVPATLGGSGPDRQGSVVTDPGPNPPAAETWWDMPAQEVHDRLLPLLPDGVTIDDYQLAPEDRAPGDPDMFSGWLHATLSTATGMTGGFEIFMYPPDPDAPDPEPSTGEPTAAASQTSDAEPTPTEVSASAPSTEDRINCPADLGAAKTCTEFDDADGIHVGRLFTWTVDGLLYREVAIQRDQGAVFYVATANSTDDKWGWGSTVSSDEPPLTLAELRAIAESDTWTDWQPPTG